MGQDVWESVLPLVSGPARYADHEWNARRRPMHQAAVRAGLLYPGTYEEGANDYTLSVAYHTINNHPDHAADRAFLPWPDMRRAMRERGLTLCGLESRKPLAEMQLIVVLVPSAASWVAVPALMSLAGISPLSADRADGDPIVVAAGRGAANPEPAAEFIDAAILGDVEDAVLDICAALADKQAAPRAARLETIAAIPGVYVPAFYAAAPGRAPQPVHPGAPAVVEHRTAPLTEEKFPSQPIVPFVETRGECAQVEMSRGCACGWAGCSEHYLGGRARPRPAAEIAALALRVVNNTGYDALSLFGADGLTPGELAAAVSECLESLGEMRVRVYLPALRSEQIAAIGGLGLPALDVDVGPASDRLRTARRLEPMDQLLASVEQAALAGTRTVRFHITVGAPGETDEDVRETALWIRRSSQLAREAAGPEGRLRLTTEIHAFCPQPHAPTQWFGVLPPDVLHRRLAALQEAVGRRAHLRVPPCEAVLLEALLARGGREMSGALHAICAHAESGLDPEACLHALRQAGVDVQGQASRQLNAHDGLPWDHLQFAASRAELAAAAQAIGLPTCRK